MEKEKCKVSGADAVAILLLERGGFLHSSQFSARAETNEAIGNQPVSRLWCSGLQGKVKAMDSEMLAVKRKQIL